MKHIHSIYALVIGSVIAPLFAFAQFGPYNTASGYLPNQGFGGFGGGNGGYGYQTRGGRIGDIESLIALAQTFLGYAQVLIFLVALFYFLWAAYSFVKGDPATGGKMLMNAVIGIVVAILAFSIIPLVCFLTQAGGRACGL